MKHDVVTRRFPGLPMRDTLVSLFIRQQELAAIEKCRKKPSRSQRLKELFRGCASDREGDGPDFQEFRELDSCVKKRQ